MYGFLRAGEPASARFGKVGSLSLISMSSRCNRWREGKSRTKARSGDGSNLLVASLHLGVLLPVAVAIGVLGQELVVRLACRLRLVLPIRDTLVSNSRHAVWLKSDDRTKVFLPRLGV